jgi:hypothetical protein
MAYPIRAHQLYNMVLVHPTRPDVVESWTSHGPRKFMDDFYGGWCPRLNQLLRMVDGDAIPEWNLRIHKPLATWVDGRVALLGDACHSTLPYVSQGAAQACEDAAVLAVALSMCDAREKSASLGALFGPGTDAGASSQPVAARVPRGPEGAGRARRRVRVADPALAAPARRARASPPRRDDRARVAGGEREP